MLAHKHYHHNEFSIILHFPQIPNPETFSIYTAAVSAKANNRTAQIAGKQTIRQTESINIIKSSLMSICEHKYEKLSQNAKARRQQNQHNFRC